jgi:HTH-type transcriptional regulator, competence development regulator
MTEQALGTVLREARHRRGLSLRDVERASGIANGHLSQLETGRIVRPDAALLWELASLYRLEFEELMRLAGHPVPTAERAALTVAFRALTELTDAERHAALAYMADLKRRRADG